jgi:hypothetical protein
VLVVGHGLLVEERLDVVADLARQLHLDQVVIDELLQYRVLFDSLYSPASPATYLSLLSKPETKLMELV